MVYDFNELLAEHEWHEIKKRIERLEFFEFERKDKAKKFSIEIGANFCDNGIWQDNYICYIHCNYNIGGSGSPYQRAEFLKLDYEKVLDGFCHVLSVERNKEYKQLCMLALL